MNTFTKNARLEMGVLLLLTVPVVSSPLTLKKGKNILRGAVINGPGLSDFCVRFVDETGNPVKEITTSLE